MSSAIPKPGNSNLRAFPPNHFHLESLRQRLRPFRLHWFARLRSTNDHAAALRKRGVLFAPAVVLAGRQTAGRGRGENRWFSTEGSLTVTFVLPPDERIAPHQLPLIAGLAMRDAVAELTGDNGIGLKWPNDLLYDGKKLGGLLCERIENVDLIGVGLNVNVDLTRAPAALRGRITSLRQIAGRAIDLTEAVAIAAAHLRLTMQRAIDQPVALLLRDYDAHHALLGRRVCVRSGDEPPICGRCEGLDASGRLLLRDRQRLYHIVAGQVEMM